MKNVFLFLPLLFLPFIILAQEVKNISVDSLSTEVDSLYREDQFYVGFGFNLLLNRPKGVTQSGFSGGLHFGFTRDMPINKRRNKAIGLGLGMSINSYGFNMLIDEKDGQTTFTEIEDSYDTNRLTSYLIEAPLEYRWRTSTASNYKFWRIYTGVRLGYVFWSRSNYIADDITIREKNLNALDKIRYGLTFTFGYNTFNFHVYYSLNSFFDGTLENSTEDVGLNPLKVGIMFYIL